VYREGNQLRVPPFNPKRVVSQDLYRKDAHGNYSLDENGPAIHTDHDQRNRTNLPPRVANASESCLFVWFSSNSRANLRGSLMIYRADSERATSWYAGFSFEGRPRIVRAEGIARQQLLEWI
jgi:hypothetical protein